MVERKARAKEKALYIPIHIATPRVSCDNEAPHDVLELFYEKLLRDITTAPGIKVLPVNDCDVPLVLSGIVRQVDGRSVLYLELTHRETSTVIWAARPYLEFELFTVLEHEIIPSLIHALKIQLPQRNSSSAKRSRADMAYLKALRRIASNTRHDLIIAQGFLKEAIALDAHYSEAYAALGHVKYKKYYNGWEGGRSALEEARSLSEYALTLDPGNEAACHALVDIYWDLGLSEKGIAVAKRAMNPGIDGKLAFILGLTNIGMSSFAIPEASRLMEVYSDDPRVQQAYIWAHLWAGQYKAAAGCATQHLRNNPQNGEIAWAAACSLHHTGASDDAIAVAEYSLSLSPLSFPLALLLGYLYYNKGSSLAAKQVWSRGLEAMDYLLEGYEDNIRLKAWRCSFRAVLGFDKEALEDIRAVEETGAANPYLFYKIFQAYSRLGREEDAQRALTLAEHGGFMNSEIMIHESFLGLSTAASYRGHIERLKGRARTALKRLDIN